MTHEEQRVGVVLGLYGAQFLIVVSPKCLLPGFVEIVAFRNVRAGAGDNFSKLGGGSVDGTGMLAGCTRIEWSPRKRRRPTISDDGQRESVQCGRICGRISRGRNCMGGRAGETFVEMQFPLPMATRSKQGVGKPRPIGRLQQEGRQPYRLISVKKCTDLILVTRPPRVVVG